MDTRIWFSRRAFKLHAVILTVVPGFMALCVWQIYRAVGGNTLSWAYVFEWPLFAAYAIYMWWRLLHEAPEDTSDAPPASVTNGAGGRPHIAAPPTTATKDTRATTAQDKAEQDKEDAELAAYNEYLEQLAEQDKAAGR